jgi:hypothetical protein
MARKLLLCLSLCLVPVSGAVAQNIQQLFEEKRTLDIHRDWILQDPKIAAQIEKLKRLPPIVVGPDWNPDDPGFCGVAAYCAPPDIDDVIVRPRVVPVWPPFPRPRVCGPNELCVPDDILWLRSSDAYVAPTVVQPEAGDNVTEQLCFAACDPKACVEDGSGSVAACIGQASMCVQKC